MTKFYTGDLVRIWKPRNVYEYPTWVSPYMDEYDGKVVRISEAVTIYNSFYCLDLDFDCIPYKFSYKWFTKVDCYLDIIWI